MPDDSPLTGTPMVLLTDEANVETTILPGFAHLERYAVPRFESISDRNTHFSDPDAEEPEEGQVIYVSGVGYQAFDGTNWVSFARLVPGLYEEYTAVRTSPLDRTTMTMTADPQLTLPVEANTLYKGQMDVYTEGLTGADIRFSFAMPADCEMTFGSQGEWWDTDKGLSSLARIDSLSPTTDLFHATRPVADGFYSFFTVKFTLWTGENPGDFAFRWAAIGSGLTAWVLKGSTLTLKRLGAA